MKNIFADICGFKSKLKPVETIVQTPSGETYLESRVSSGFRKSPIDSTTASSRTRSFGFVVDFKPDLQLAEILPGLYLGSQDVASERELLRSKRITHIINVASGIDNHFEDEFRYQRHEIYDIPEANISKIFEKCADFIEESIRQGGATLVHCNAGISRSSTICIAYLMLRERMRLQEAIDHVRSLRPVIRPNEGFLRQLHELDAKLFSPT